MNTGILVIVESPFFGDISTNIRYARACVKDCFQRGEFPFASHLIYAQTGILRDDVLGERQLGIDAGLAWGEKADKTVVYIDLGISGGMQTGIWAARQSNRIIEYRTLANWRDYFNNNGQLSF